MASGRTPNWLSRLEKPLGWLAIPQLAILLVTLQALGFLLISSNPVWINQLALIPEAVRVGELWRLVTFLSIPLSYSPLWLFFALWFLYFVMNTLENEWGAFRSTLYVLISVLVTIVYAMTFNYPVLQVRHFESTLFLAAAALYPDMEVSLFMVIPVKLKYLAAITAFFVLIELAQGDWLDRFYLIAIYSNFLVFFGPAALDRVRQHARRKSFERRMRDR